MNPDDSKGRRLYHARAEAEARLSIGMGRGKRLVERDRELSGLEHGDEKRSNADDEARSE